MTTNNNNSPESIGLLDRRIGKHMDVFRLALVHAAEKTPLPEILEVFGNELTVKFLDIFAGTTIKIPSREVITNAARDADIYLTIKSAQNPKDAYQLLADRYEFDVPYVKQLYANMEKVFSKNYKMVTK